jgi:hypothetical protein
VLEAASYRFQLARDPAFQDTVVQVDNHRANELATTQAIVPGEYFWRVASRRADGDVGPWGDAQHMVLKPIPLVSQEDSTQTVADHGITLKWKAGAPGQKYQLQLARNASFEPLLKDVVLDEPTAELPRPAGGQVYTRVRVIDSDGFIGPYNSAQVIKVPAKYPPLKLRLDERAASFSWLLDSQQKLHLQVARDPSFSAPLVDSILTDASVSIPRPIGPRFYARVAVIDSDGFKGPFSDAWPLDIATLYPGIDAPVMEQGILRFKWSAPASGQRIRFQLARDNAFQSLIYDGVRSDTGVIIESPGAGSYFLRLAVVGRDGFESPFGPPHRVDVPRRSLWPLLLGLPLLLL